MPRYRVSKTFSIDSKNVKVFSGQIIEGTIRNGMKIIFNELDKEIDSIEFLNCPGNFSEVALLVKNFNLKEFSSDYSGESVEVKLKYGGFLDKNFTSKQKAF